jgi:imidazolonepropionase-like amidohydrolase
LPLLLCLCPFLAVASDAPSFVVIEGCSVFDPESGKMLDGRTIVVRGERIVAVTTQDDKIEIPQEATRIDGRGKFALPGLIDAHVHVVHVLDFAQVTGDEVLPLYLAAGVTSGVCGRPGVPRRIWFGE